MIKTTFKNDFELTNKDKVVHFVESAMNSKSWNDFDIYIIPGDNNDKWSFEVEVTSEKYPDSFCMICTMPSEQSEINYKYMFKDPYDTEIAPIVTFLSGGQKYAKVSMRIIVPINTKLYFHSQIEQEPCLENYHVKFRPNGVRTFKCFPKSNM